MIDGDSFAAFDLCGVSALASFFFFFYTLDFKHNDKPSFTSCERMSCTVSVTQVYRRWTRDTFQYQISHVMYIFPSRDAYVLLTQTELT